MMIACGSLRRCVVLCLLTVVSNLVCACQDCTDSIVSGRFFTPREHALVDMLDTCVPLSTKRALNWHCKADILHCCRFTVRYKRAGDWFAGHCGFGGAVDRLSPGSTCSQLDISIGGTIHNICTPEGMAFFIIDALEMCTGATMLSGLPCSTFVWLSRGTSMRSVLNHWLGDCHHRPEVHEANVIFSRLILLIRILILRLVQWIIEQPLTSCAFKLNMCKALVRSKPAIRLPCSTRTLRIRRHLLWLGHYGHAVPKPTVLVGMTRAIHRLKTVRPKKQSTQVVKFTTLKWVVKNNKWKLVRRMYGCKRELKNTQIYPRAFCEEVVRHQLA